MAVNLQGVGLTLEGAITMVQTGDSSDQYYAAWYLGHLQDVQAVDVLLEALHDTQSRTALGGYPLRRKAAEALGRIGDLRAVAPLITALDCPDLYLREAIAWSLGELGDPRGIAPLVGLLDPRADQPHEAIIEALGKLARKLKDPLTLAQPQIAAYADHPSERIRCAAARGLYLLTGDAQYGEFLVGRLESTDIHIRRAVMFDLAEIAYLPAAAAMARCDVTHNLKVHALKQMVDLSMDRPPEELEGVLATMAALF